MKRRAKKKRFVRKVEFEDCETFWASSARAFIFMYGLMLGQSLPSTGAVLVLSLIICIALAFFNQPNKKVYWEAEE